MALHGGFFECCARCPGGGCLSMLMEKRYLWPVVLTAELFSEAIEITQLVTKCGLFGSDDIFHNTLGAVVGSMIVNVYRKRGSLCHR